MQFPGHELLDIEPVATRAIRHTQQCRHVGNIPLLAFE